MSGQRKEVLAIIPARGGSKGIPGKNLQPLDGIPLLVHTIKAALAAERVTRVVVSTDDEGIASVARDAGAEVPVMRPAELATDTSPTEPSMTHMVEWLEKEQGYRPDAVVLLQATSPLRGPGPIDACVSAVLSGDFDSALTACEDRSFYWEPKQGKERGEVKGGEALPVASLYDYTSRPRRQDMAPRYRENGAVYAIRRDLFISGGNRLGGRIGAVLMPVMDSVEIDDPQELELAGLVLELKKKQTNGRT
jgi:N-acylneuraminate cytidylyltransferase